MNETVPERRWTWAKAIWFGRREMSGDRQSGHRWLILVSALLALVIFLTTLQLGINGTEHRYATDVGEIQNALPRWGTIHFTGYPQYTALGSVFVNVLQLVRVPPATGASLYSAVWGAIAAGLLTALVLHLHVPGPFALLAPLLFTLSTSVWVDGSLAELHTMTMALTFGALWMAARFWRHGRTADLYWLVFLSSQGVTHQRAFAFLAPALVVLVWRHWRIVLRKWLPVLAIAMTGPLTYLYLPLVDRLGSGWVFSAPGTWDGFWALILDTKAGRIISIPGSLGEIAERLRALFAVLSDDLPAPIWVSGLLGLTFSWRRIALTERVALTLTWLVYFVLSLVIWVGFVGDAVLAAKLPVIAMATVGLTFIAADVARRAPRLEKVALLAGMLMVVFLFVNHRPQVLQITRDDSAAETIADVEAIPQAPDGRPITFVALWGNDYWQLAYAQRYMGRFPDLKLVDHNANFGEILARGDHLYTLSRTFATRPLPAWEESLGPLQLSSVMPGIIEIRHKEMLADPAQTDRLPLDNGIAIHKATLTWWDDQTLLLAVQWRMQTPTDRDYSVAVHLVSQDPPTGPQDLLAQADSLHPVDGWYPTSQWEEGELVGDHYLLEVADASAATAVRVGMYRLLNDGTFQNSAVLSLPLPPRP